MSSSTSVALAPGGSARRPLTLRVLARLRAHGLDRRIAAGADPAASRLLAARAAGLVDRRARTALATDLEHLVDLAETGTPRPIGAVPVRAREVAAAAGPLRELIDLLRGPDALAPRGVAIARGMITDGRAPVYARAPSGAVARLAREALAHALPRFLRS